MLPLFQRAIETIARARAPKEPPSPRGAAIAADLGILEHPPCPLCGATRGRTLWVAGDDWLNGGAIAGLDPAQRFAVIRCEVCTARYTSPRLKKSHRALAYPKEYPFYVRARNARERSGSSGPKELARARRAFLGRADRLASVIPRPGRLLDLGCGDGFFLDVMRARGWEVSGIDVEESVIWYARDRLGLKDVGAADMEDDPLPEGPFDAVTLWGSLQLAYDPRRLLEKIRRVLAPEGVLAIGVSNVRSAGAVIFGRHWYGLGVPRHLVHYTPATLGRLLEWTGFRAERFAFETPRWIAAGSVDAAISGVKTPLRRIAKAAVYAAGPVLGRTEYADTMELYARLEP